MRGCRSRTGRRGARAAGSGTRPRSAGWRASDPIPSRRRSDGSTADEASHAIGVDEVQKRPAHADALGDHVPGPEAVARRVELDPVDEPASGPFCTRRRSGPGIDLGRTRSAAGCSRTGSENSTSTLRRTSGPCSTVYRPEPSVKKSTQIHLRLASARPQVVTGVICEGISSPAPLRTRTFSVETNSPCGKGMPNVTGRPRTLSPRP